VSLYQKVFYVNAVKELKYFADGTPIVPNGINSKGQVQIRFSTDQAMSTEAWHKATILAGWTPFDPSRHSNVD
jgi:hypothetical protein